MASDVNKFHFRLVLLGANKTGKTSILNRFLFKKFEEKYKPTVEDLFSKEFDLGSIELKVDFLDTSGSMQFPAMRRLSITTGDAFLIVYALDDENSYEVLKLCMAEIQEIRQDFQEIPIVFVGNKCDLAREQRKVPKEMVSNYVYYELPRLRTKVIECSCKENVNIENIFKSYLSLARVSLSTTVIIQNSGSRQQQHHHNSLTNKKRPSSTIPSESVLAAADSSNSSRCASPKKADFESRLASSCAASIKEALGVRKSCDASIVSSMRKVSLTGPNSRNSREQLLESMNEFELAQQEHRSHQHQQPTKQQPLHSSSSSGGSGGGGGNNNSNIQSQEPAPPMRRLNQKSSIESLLKDAKRQQQLSSKLSVNSIHGGTKPRSRSLIWRPSRKSSRTAPNDASECHVS